MKAFFLGLVLVAGAHAETQTDIEYARVGELSLKLDLHRPHAVKPPLIVYVHGGAWRAGDKNVSSKTWQVPYFLSKGHAFASVNYRLVPDVGVAQQAEDVARSLKFLVDRADALGLDRKRIVLMGHSAGAHLAALVAGNTVILKPAPETVRTAWVMVNALWRAGISRKVLQFVPCPDNEIGKALVTDGRIGAVVLTGAYETARMFLSWKPELRLFAEN
jgi:pimeloyl-ACP methyl ester carboxylesterase